MPKTDISGLYPEELAGVMKELGQPAFRAGQLFDWLHGKRVAAFPQMTNLPAALRDVLEERYSISRARVSKKQASSDGTVKYLFALEDENHIEAVLMHYHHGNTLCVSSQVGCRMGCGFCASTQGGLVRNLTAGEMLAEVYAAMEDSGEAVSNVVLMGIGEPLDNFDEVVRFIRIVTHEKGLNLSGRGISLSTCGLVPEIDALAKEKLPLTLSVSLHAASDDKRSAMMPVNRRWPIKELLAACRRYTDATGRRISFEYAMVRGVNDTPQDAQALAGLLKGMLAHVNLIPVNPVDGSPYGPSDAAAVNAFKSTLEGLGLNATVRRRLGTDIDAACGQLRQKHEGE